MPLPQATSSASCRPLWKLQKDVSLSIIQTEHTPEPSFSSNYQNVSFITKESKHLKDTLPNYCSDTQTEVFVGLSAFP